jgi:hypothetical protein
MNHGLMADMNPESATLSEQAGAGRHTAQRQPCRCARTTRTFPAGCGRSGRLLGGGAEVPGSGHASSQFLASGWNTASCCRAARPPPRSQRSLWQLAGRGGPLLPGWRRCGLPGLPNLRTAAAPRSPCCATRTSPCGRASSCTVRLHRPARASGPRPTQPGAPTDSGGHARRATICKASRRAVCKASPAAVRALGFGAACMRLAPPPTHDCV